MIGGGDEGGGVIVVTAKGLHTHDTHLYSSCLGNIFYRSQSKIDHLICYEFIYLIKLISPLGILAIERATQREGDTERGRNRERASQGEHETERGKDTVRERRGARGLEREARRGGVAAASGRSTETAASERGR